MDTAGDDIMSLAHTALENLVHDVTAPDFTCPVWTKKILLAGCSLLLVIKATIEIWWQYTPTWVAPNDWFPFFIIYFGIFPALIWANGRCFAVEDVTLFGDGDAGGKGEISPQMYQYYFGFALFVLGSAYSRRRRGRGGRARRAHSGFGAHAVSI